MSSRLVVLERSEAAFPCEQKRAVQDDESGEAKMSVCRRRDLSVWDGGVVEVKAGGGIGAEAVGVVEAEAGSVGEAEAVESSKAVGNGEARAVKASRRRQSALSEQKRLIVGDGRKRSAEAKKKAARLRTKSRKMSAARQARGSSSGRAKAHKHRREWGHSCLTLTRPDAGVFIRRTETVRDKYSTRNMS